MSPLRILTLVAATLLVVVGLLLVFGVVGTAGPEPRLRVTAGVIFVLMGLYRAALGFGRGRDEGR